MKKVMSIVMSALLAMSVVISSTAMAFAATSPSANTVITIGTVEGTDKDGNPVKIPAKDKDGNAVVDKDGNAVYIELQVTQTPLTITEEQKKALDAVKKTGSDGALNESAINEILGYKAECSMTKEEVDAFLKTFGIKSDVTEEDIKNITNSSENGKITPATVLKYVVKNTDKYKTNIIAYQDVSLYYTDPTTGKKVLCGPNVSLPEGGVDVTLPVNVNNPNAMIEFVGHTTVNGDNEIVGMGLVNGVGTYYIKCHFNTLSPVYVVEVSKVTSSDKPVVSAPTTSQNPDKPATGGNGYTVWVIAILAIALVAVVAVIVVKKTAKK